MNIKNVTVERVLINFFLVTLIAFVIGCNKEKVDTERISNKDTAAVRKSNDSTGKDIRNKERVFEGIYIINQNVNTFRDCMNPDSVYWVNDETGNLKKIYEKIYSVKNVYGAVYARMKGELKETEGINSEKYPATLYVKEILQVEKKNFRNTCISYDFWALGNEPNWELQISRNENIIEFYDLAENKTYYCFYEEPVDEDGIIVYAAHNNIQRYTIKIRIRKEKCSDTMSDTAYEYSAEVELSNGKKFKGCAIKGKER